MSNVNAFLLQAQDAAPEQRASTPLAPDFDAGSGWGGCTGQDSDGRRERRRLGSSCCGSGGGGDGQSGADAESYASALQSAKAQVHLLQGQARQHAQEKAALQKRAKVEEARAQEHYAAIGQHAQEKAALQRRAEAAEARAQERDAAARQAERRFAELQRHARGREAVLQQQVEAAEERAQELESWLVRAQQDARIPDVHPVAQALLGGISTASHTELATATHNFAAGSILGRGGFGPVYRGEWGGQAVAIKRLDQASLPLCIAASQRYHILRLCVLSTSVFCDFEQTVSV